MLGKPLIINSAYRCPEHNKNVGGAPKSKHVEGTAFDISTRGWTSEEVSELYDAAKKAGFKGFGHYSTFMHVDMGPRREWEG